MHSTAFLPNEDMLELVLFEKRIVNRQDSAARIAEYDFNTKVCQSLDDDFRTGHVFTSHVALRTFLTFKPYVKICPHSAKSASNFLPEHGFSPETERACTVPSS